MLRLELSSMTVGLQYMCANDTEVMGSDQNCDAFNTFDVLNARFLRFHPVLTCQQTNLEQ